MKSIDFSKINWRKIFSLRNAMVIFLGASLYAQLDHTAAVAAYLARKGGDSGHAYAFALAVEMSVLLFVLAGHRWLSWGFAVATFLTNLSYYWVQLDGAWWSPEAPMAILVSLLLPAVIVGYSHSIAPAHVAKKKDEAPQDDAKADAGEAHATQTPAQETQNEERACAEETQNAQPTQKMSADQRRMHIKESGVTDAAQIAAQYGISKRQAQQDLRKIREDDAELHDPQVVLREVRAQVVQVNGVAH